MSEDKPVVRCVCFDKTFRELKEAGVNSIEEIQQRFGCSTKCGLCRPYLEKMLQTGDTEFAVIPLHHNDTTNTTDSQRG